LRLVLSLRVRQQVVVLLRAGDRTRVPELIPERYRASDVIKKRLAEVLLGLRPTLKLKLKQTRKFEPVATATNWIQRGGAKPKNSSARE
jgi:hypothetical protein